jgi:hypothetical protein
MSKVTDAIELLSEKGFFVAASQGQNFYQDSDEMARYCAIQTAKQLLAHKKLHGNEEQGKMNTQLLQTMFKAGVRQITITQEAHDALVGGMASATFVEPQPPTNYSLMCGIKINID